LVDRGQLLALRTKAMEQPQWEVIADHRVHLATAIPDTDLRIQVRGGGRALLWKRRPCVAGPTVFFCVTSMTKQTFNFHLELIPSALSHNPSWLPPMIIRSKR
jgi:hypothetical protein